VIEGRLRMNTVPRQDGTKEKRAEFTLSRLHSVGAAGSSQGQPPAAARTAPARPVPTQATPQSSEAPTQPAAAGQDSAAQWNTSPLVPETDDIPFKPSKLLGFTASDPIIALKLVRAADPVLARGPLDPVSNLASGRDQFVRATKLYPSPAGQSALGFVSAARTWGS
jgi:hypothetical protein